MRFDPKVPPTLLRLQKKFGTLIARPLGVLGQYKIPIYNARTEKEIEKWITCGPHLNAAQRMGIYHQQFWFRLLNLLHEVFPSLVRLFGYRDFNEQIAEKYLLSYFPNHWSLSQAVRKLPQWIREEYHEEDKLLVLQMAEIDEAYDRIVQAKKKKALQGIPLVLEKKIHLQPTIELFELDGDFFSFRKALLEKNPDQWLELPFPKIDWSQKRWAFLWFVNSQYFCEEISEEEYLLLKAFQRGATIETACERIEGRKVETKVGSWFQFWAQKQWIY